MKSFVVVLVPRGDLDRRRYLWGEHWLQSVRNYGPQCGVTLVAPQREAATFPFALRGGASDGELVVEPGNQGEFSGAIDTCLFFKRPVEHGLALSDRGRAYFQHTPPAHVFGTTEGDAPDRGSLFADDGAGGGWSRHLLWEVPSEPKVGHRRIEQSSVDAGEADGWVNPVLLRFELGARACALAPPRAEDGPKGLQAVLADWLGGVSPKGRVVAILPEFSRSATMTRALGWSEILRRRPGPAFPGAPSVPFSAIERFWVGGQAAPGGEVPPRRSFRSKPSEAKPVVEPALWTFLALDALGGRFVLEEHGSGSPRYTWQPPTEWDEPQADDLAEAGGDLPSESIDAAGDAQRPPYANARWFAGHLVRRWGAGLGLLSALPEATSSVAECQFALGSAAPDGRAVVPPAKGVQYDWTRAERQYSKHEVAAWNLSDALSAVAAEFAEPPDPLRGIARLRRPRLDVARERPPHRVAGLLQWLCQRLLEVPGGSREIPGALHQRRLSFDSAAERETLLLRQDPLLDEAAAAFLAPASPVLVALPVGGGVDMLLDVLRSVPFGYYAWLALLLRGPATHWPDQAPEEPPRERLVERKRGWWGHWHPLLFRREAGVPIRFVGGGFTLGEGQLGDAELGEVLLGAADLLQAKVEFSFPFDQVGEATGGRVER